MKIHSETIERHRKKDIVDSKAVLIYRNNEEGITLECTDKDDTKFFFVELSKKEIKRLLEKAE